MNSEEHDDDWPIGEHPYIPPEVIAEHIARTDENMALTFMRRVGIFKATDGQKYSSGLSQVKDIEPTENPGEFKASLRSHRKMIVIGGGALLLAVGAEGVRLKRNRTQRKKMRPYTTKKK